MYLYHTCLCRFDEQYILIARVLNRAFFGEESTHPLFNRDSAIKENWPEIPLAYNSFFFQFTKLFAVECSSTFYSPITIIISFCFTNLASHGTMWTVIIITNKYSNQYPEVAG